MFGRLECGFVLNILQCESSCLLVRECVCIRVRNCFVLMGAPSPDECYMLRNWDTCVVCGFWIRIGREMLAVDYRGLGQAVFSDYAPFNMDGGILAFNQNAKGYWRFNLPLARGKQVRFHRRLLQDVLGRRLSDKQAHHLDHQKGNNVLSNLSPAERGPHCAAHGAEGGRKKRGKGSGPGGKRRKTFSWLGTAPLAFACEKELHP